MRLLTTDNLKIRKGDKYGYLGTVLMLAPSTLSGHNVCPMASAGCKAACLNTAGNGLYPATQEARIKRTRWFFEDRTGFMRQLAHELSLHIAKANREGKIPVVRLNGTSDIRWENIPVVTDGKVYRNIMARFSDVQFYDYTKLPNRRNLPDNYHLTFSRSEVNEAHAIGELEAGKNVAVVFRLPKGKVLPETWNGFRVISGDEHDLRFLDPAGVVIGLKAKGSAWTDMSGFTIRL